jgi:hypothetical protein
VQDWPWWAPCLARRDRYTPIDAGVCGCMRLGMRLHPCRRYCKSQLGSRAARAVRMPQAAVGAYGDSGLGAWRGAPWRAFVIPISFPAAADGLEWVRLHVLLSPLPSSLAWRRPRGCLCSGRGRTLAGAARITPPELPKLVRSPQPLPPDGARSRRCVQSACTSTAYPPKTWPPSCARVSRNPLAGPAASTTPTSSLTLPQHGKNQATRQRRLHTE